MLPRSVHVCEPLLAAVCMRSHIKASLSQRKGKRLNETEREKEREREIERLGADDAVQGVEGVRTHTTKIDSVVVSSSQRMDTVHHVAFRNFSQL